jgi:hypothetical protein
MTTEPEPVVRAPHYATMPPAEPTIDRLLRPTTDPDAIITLFPSSLGGRPYTQWEAVEWLGNLPAEHRVSLRQTFGDCTLREILVELAGHRANCAANVARERAVAAQYADYPPLHEVERWRRTLASILAALDEPGQISKATIRRFISEGA